MPPQHIHPPRGLSIVDCTLREGEQFAHAAFSSEQRVEIARRLAAFGVETVELTSPRASPRAARDFAAIAALGLPVRIAAHVRCERGDVDAALAAGAKALHLFFGTSRALQTHSHGRSVDELVALAREVVPAARAGAKVVRVSCEDAFRTPVREVLKVAQALEDLGVDRVGLADTVGAATPDEVASVVSIVRRAVDCDIEFHGHNDGGCAIANVWAAHRAGATHLDTTVLGIGERNGIASLSGLVARAAQSQPELLAGFALEHLVDLDRYVARSIGIDVPFNACITSPTAFAHKAGLHGKAVLADPSTYESLDPRAFGIEREVLAAHALVGRHVLAHRARALGLALDADALANAANELKTRADDTQLSNDDVADVLRRHAASTPHATPLTSTLQ
jgi:homocitrate synthase